MQSASNTAAQIFYFRNIASGGDNITVTFSGSADTSSGCVVVEYAGLDVNYPLDSVSSAYSISAGTALDSGNAAPAKGPFRVCCVWFTDAESVFAVLVLQYVHSTSKSGLFVVLRLTRQVVWLGPFQVALDLTGVLIVAKDATAANRTKHRRQLFIVPILQIKPPYRRTFGTGSAVEDS